MEWKGEHELRESIDRLICCSLVVTVGVVTGCFKFPCLHFKATDFTVYELRETLAALILIPALRNEANTSVKGKGLAYVVFPDCQ